MAGLLGVDQLKSQGIVRWRLGTYAAFGKGLTEDDDGNKVWQLLEVDAVDHSPVYGNVDVSTEEEKAFELSHLVSGSPDYPNNIAALVGAGLAQVITDEPVYVFPAAASAGAYVRNVFTEYGGIIALTPGTDVTVAIRAKATGAIKVSGTLAFTANFTMVDYAAPDRLKDVTDVLKTNEFQITQIPCDVVAGDYLTVTYTRFTHSDMLRDGEGVTAWSSQLGKPNTYLLFDLSPSGSVGMLQSVNNLELVSVNGSFPMGGKEYILQVGYPDAAGQIRFKVVATGRLPATAEGKSIMLKFERTQARYIRLVLIGSVYGPFASVECMSDDIALAGHAPVGVSSNSGLDISDYYDVSIVPYYVNTQAVDIQGTLVTGNPIGVQQLLGIGSSLDPKSIARLYIPQYNIQDIDSRKGYILSHYTLRMGNTAVYHGIPSPFLATAQRFTLDDVYTGKTIGVGDNTADIVLSMQYDLISRNTNPGETAFQTMFKDIAAWVGLWRILVDGTPVFLTLGTDYSVNLTTGAVTLFSPLTAGEGLQAKYKFRVIKNAPTALEANLRFLRTVANREAVQYAEARIFPSIYFKEYLVNDESEVMEFDINPDTYSNKLVSNKVASKMLGGTFRKQRFGPTKARIACSGPKISKEMFELLKLYEDKSELLGLTTDTLEFFKGFIAPDTLQGTRRKTSASEQEEYTTSYSYSLEFQES
jgi:hypothetical protein